MEVSKGVLEALQNWFNGCASLAEIRSLAADLGNNHYLAGIPALVQLLDHEDAIVRYNATMSLAFEFLYTAAAEKFLRMLAQDPDEDCRSVAAGALGNLFQNSRDRRLLIALGESALNDLDEAVRSSAFKALQIVNGVSREEHLRLLRSQPLPVDRERVQKILAEAP